MRPGYGVIPEWLSASFPPLMAIVAEPVAAHRGSAAGDWHSTLRGQLESGYTTQTRMRAARLTTSSSSTMAEVETQETTVLPGAWSRIGAMTRDVRRGFIAEWTVTIILLLFATTTLVQAFVIPSASM